MIFSSLSKREKAILFLVLGIIAASFIYNFVLEPFMNKWVDLNGQISAKKAKLEKCVRLISKAQNYSEEYSRYAAQSEGVKSDEEHVALVLSFVESTARKANVYINSMKPNSIKEKNFYKIILIEADIEAPIKDLTVFLYEIKNSPKMLKVKSVDINAKSTPANSVKARVLISDILF